MYWSGVPCNFTSWRSCTAHVLEKKSVHREGNVNPVQMESFYHNHTHSMAVFSRFSAASLFTLITDKQEVTSLNEHRCGRDEQRVSLRVCFLFDQVSPFALSGRSEQGPSWGAITLSVGAAV